LELFGFLYFKLEKYGVKKKYDIILPILLIVEFLTIINPVNAFNCNLITLDTNQTEYYINEDINIFASWELYFNPANEIAYIQIHILDDSDQIIWNSSKNNQIGTHEQNWTVNIEEFILDPRNDSYILFIKFFIFYFQIDTTNTMYTYLDTIEIRAIKRNVECELIGYKDHIKIGEKVSLIAKFYTESSESVFNLTNETIQFMTSFNNIIIYYSNYTTDTRGTISFQISSLTHLKLGQNFLIFFITNNRIFNDSKFVYEIFVEKNPILIDINRFSETLKKNEELEINLRFYYYFNQSLKHLANYNILLKIIDNKTPVFIKEYETDKFGNLTINISQEFFNFDQKSQKLIVNIYFNGTYFLDNKTLSLDLKLNQDVYSEIYNSFQVNFFSFISILVIILILFSYILTNKRSKSKKLLTDLIIRY